jgi:hypothetical protein
MLKRSSDLHVSCTPTCTKAVNNAVCNAMSHVSVRYVARLLNDDTNDQSFIEFWQDHCDADVFGLLRSFRCHSARKSMMSASWQTAVKPFCTSPTANQLTKNFPTFHAAQFYYYAYQSPTLLPIMTQFHSLIVSVGGRLGSLLRGYHPVEPRPLRYGPFVHRL